MEIRGELLALLRLSLVPGISPRAQRALMGHFGNAAAVFAASHDELATAAGPAMAFALGRGPVAGLLDRTLRWAQRPGQHLLGLDDPAYPEILRHLHDPPVVLYVTGRAELLNASCLAIVGSRNATPQGVRDAHDFARTLSDAGLCIVSGLALGVDAAAHRGGLAGCSSSIAVMGTGADVVYPPRNRALAHQLAESGCVITEFCLGMPPLPENFPRRNRLISGLARGVLVVEANERSGSLGTAHLAADQGRDVFAIPGSIHSTLSRGCHKLIKEGAKLVENVGDVMAELGLAGPVECPAGAKGVPKVADPLLAVMGFDPVSLDELCARTGLAPAALAAQVSILEIDGRIAALPGGRFQQIDGSRRSP